MHMSVEATNAKPAVDELVKFHVHLDIADGVMASLRIFYTRDGMGSGVLADYASCDEDSAPTPSTFDKEFRFAYPAKYAGTQQPVVVEVRSDSCQTHRQFSAKVTGTVEVSAAK
jgi:hypothetical protein